MERTDQVAGRLDAGCAAVGSERIGNAKVEMEARAKREPSFDELGIEQKINRLRDAMMTLAVMGERATGLANEANRIAKVHDHGSGGQVVVPLEGDNRAIAMMEAGEGPFRRVQRLLG